MNGLLWTLLKVAVKTKSERNANTVIHIFPLEMRKKHSLQSPWRLQIFYKWTAWIYLLKES